MGQYILKAKKWMAKTLENKLINQAVPRLVSVRQE